MSMSRRSLIRTSGLAGVGGVVGIRAGSADAVTAPGRRPRTGLRMLTWNIFHGGHGVGDDNLPLLLDQLVAIGPDIYLAVETYGSGERIRAALSRRAGHGEYTGIKITQRPPGTDNLWIFTHLPVVDVYPSPSGGRHITDFNLGGVRLRLPSGRELNVFDTWISYTNPWIGYLIDENAAGIRAGLKPRHPDVQVNRADERQTDHVEEILSQHLPAMLAATTLH